LDDHRNAASESTAGLLYHMKPIDTGLDSFPVVTISDQETMAIARGQFVRPAGGLPGQADHYRLRDPEGRLVAIATADGGRLAPDKVFVAPVTASAVSVP
ncbi:MAG: tRNA pseudouridine(55) synthase TruB, partial [Chloroflexota bacterium]